MPKNFWTGDCETDPFKFGREPKPFLWCFYHPEYGHFLFEKTKDAADFMKERDAIIYFHNGGKFDMMFLAEYFNRDEKCLMINSRLVQVKLGKAELRDSYALLPFAQAQITSKLEIDDFSIFEKQNRKKKKNWEIIVERAKTDCQYMWEVIDAFFNEYGRHLTAASAAIKTLSKIEDIKIENSGPVFFSEISKYYYGGRCQCLQPGEYKNEKLTYLDINSAYPFAMLHDHPTGCEFYHGEGKPHTIKPHGFYTVKAKSYGAFCRREKSGLKFDHDGEIRIYHTTGHELLAAIETKKAKILKYIEYIHFYETRNFKRFIDHFWMIRQTSKKGSTENIFAKLMMNSAYGKFCANPENYDNYIFSDPAIAEFLVSEGWEIRGEKGGHVLVSRPLEENSMRYYNVATGASITGFVRAMLMRALANVDNAIYCDTDSIIFTGNHKLSLSGELGNWKLEGEFTEGYFAGKKMYGVRRNREIPKVATKGARLSYKQIKDITKGKVVTYRQDAPSFSWKKKQVNFLERKVKKTA